MPFDDSDPADNYRMIRDELGAYSEELMKKIEIVIVTKLDLTDAADSMREMKSKLKIPVIGISAVTGQGLDELKEVIWATLQTVKQE
jgi:GTP-binding protein